MLTKLLDYRARAFRPGTSGPPGVTGIIRENRDEFRYAHKFEPVYITTYNNRYNSI